MEKFYKFLERFGWFGFIRLFFYPITALIATPIRLVQTLWDCRVLADGKWSKYNRFTAGRAINSLFYWTQAINIDRYGRSGTSPYIGLGSYKLSKWFHISLPSLYLYWRLAPIVPIAGLFGWSLAHLVWLDRASPGWVLIVMGLATASTTFYANTFVLQNYNAAGWLFFPFGLYGMSTEQWLIAGLVWLAASFGSFTVVFLAGILSLVAAVSNWNIAPLLAVLPAGLKLLTHFWPSISGQDLKKIIIQVMQSIGMTESGVKYQRTSSKRLGLNEIYYLLSYGQFLLIFYLMTNHLPPLLITGIGIFLINSTYVRFADMQSMHMLMFSLATAATMQNPEYWLLPSYWILASPLPRLAGFASMRDILDVLPKLAPFSVTPFIEGMEAFLSPVQKEQRILMAFEDPKGVYENVFDGYRTLLELPLYVAATKEIHFMPDWWGVFETNYKGAPDFWGRDIDSVQKNIERWNADYVVIYQNAGTELEDKWQSAGFTVLNCFSWANYEKHLRGERLFLGETPTWWLLKKRAAKFNL